MAAEIGVLAVDRGHRCLQDLLALPVRFGRGTRFDHQYIDT